MRECMPLLEDAVLVPMTIQNSKFFQLSSPPVKEINSKFERQNGSDSAPGRIFVPPRETVTGARQFASSVSPLTEVLGC